MTDNLTNKNPFLKHDDEFWTPAEGEFFYPSSPDAVDSDDDESDSGRGIATLGVEELAAYLQAAFNRDRRERVDGQKKFGLCPYSEDPNSLLGKKRSNPCGLGEAIQSHPLLAHSQQFSGDDPSISANPIENSEAKEQFPEKRLQNQYRLQKNLGLGARKSVTLAR